MPNLVPIQFLALLGYAILRITIGLVFIVLALRHRSEAKTLITTIRIPYFPWPRTIVWSLIFLEFVIGLLFVLGLFTQGAAVLGGVWCLTLMMYRAYLKHPIFPDNLTTVLILGVCVTLFITGAGVLAFDLPI